MQPICFGTAFFFFARSALDDEHLRILKKAAAAKVDGIITQGLTEAEFVPVINEITDKNIPVVTIDTDAPTSRRVAYVGTDNYYAGFLAGRALAEDTKGKATVAIITGSLTAAHQQLRVRGFEDAVRQEKGIRIVAIEESHITRVQAAEKAYTILKKHPDVNAFYGTSALDAIGVAKVVEQFHREQKTYIIGFDTLPETIRYLQKGTIAATVVQEPYEMGYKAVKMMAEIVAGRDVPAVTNTETKVIRKKDLLSITGFVVVAIWQFTNIWNEFLFAVTITTSDKQPIMVALQNLSGSQIVQWNVQMAGALLAALPTLLVYIFLGKYFVRGLLAGSVKG